MWRVKSNLSDVHILKFVEFIHTFNVFQNLIWLIQKILAKFNKPDKRNQQNRIQSLIRSPSLLF